MAALVNYNCKSFIKLNTVLYNSLYRSLDPEAHLVMVISESVFKWALSALNDVVQTNFFCYRCTHFLPSELKSDHASWTVARDHALVRYVDTLCRTWSTTPSRLMPDELILSDEVLASDDFHVLQGKFTKLTCRVWFSNVPDRFDLWLRLPSVKEF